jgi:hypothetical protein
MPPDVRTGSGELGRGVLAVWNDVAAGKEDEFDDWYLREHLLERLSVPGFLRARRWWNPERSPRYFTCYDTVDVEILRSAAYVARLEEPTPRTRGIMPSFRNTSRTACRVTARLRSGDGGAVGVLRLSPDREAGQRLRAWLASDALPSVAALRGVVAVQLWESDEADTGNDRLESTLRPGEDTTIDWAVVVEATRPVEAARGFEALSRATEHGAVTVEAPEQYVLLCQMSR